jgi:hypothetical protein
MRIALVASLAISFGTPGLFHGTAARAGVLGLQNV